jgi:ferredoxin
MCSCGSCRVILISGEVSEMDDMEEATLSVVQEGDEDRLGCQTKILGHVVVEVPDQDF